MKPKGLRKVPLLLVAAALLSLAPLAWQTAATCQAGTLHIERVDPSGAEGVRATEERSFSSYSTSQLRMFGVVMVPRTAYVQDTYRGIRFLATRKSRYTKRHLALLKYFIDRTPAALLRPGPSAIITYGRGEVRFPPGTSATSLAMASGPYVFFNTSAFDTSGLFSAGSIDGVFRAFEHELAHVMQFHEAAHSIDMKEAVARFLDDGTQVIWSDAAMETGLVKSFVEVTGWHIRRRGGRITARLSNRRLEQTSSYGKANVLEDMAETMSLVAVGDISGLSPGRIDWAVAHLGFSSIKEALENTFPYSVNYSPVKIRGVSVTRFDRSKAQAFRKRYGFVDMEHFVNRRKRSYSAVIRELQRELGRRGWTRNSVERMRLPHGVLKTVMRYSGRWRDLYMEAVTYDYATGYTLKPVGTILTVLSGYKIR